MNKLKFELNNIVNFSGPKSIDYNNGIKIIIHYRRHSKELFVSHFFLFQLITENKESVRNIINILKNMHMIMMILINLSSILKRIRLQ